MHLLLTDTNLGSQQLLISMLKICINPSLRSKRFQSSYSAKFGAGAKKNGRGRGKGREETLARKPHDFEKRP